MRRTIGVAIGIPKGIAEELEGWRERFGDPAAHLMQAHITLLPPTDIKDVPAVEQHLASVAGRHAAFPLELQGTGTFRPLSPVVYVRVTTGSREVATLESDVRSGPLARSLRFPYHPHVTVAHDVPDETLTWAQQALADYHAAFDVDHITLFERAADGLWEPQRDFPLL